MKKYIVWLLALIILIPLVGCTKESQPDLIKGLKKEYVSDEDTTYINFKIPKKAKVTAYFSTGTKYTGLERKGSNVKMFVYAGDKSTYTIKAKLNNQTEKQKFTIKPTKELANSVSQETASLIASSKKQNSESTTSPATRVQSSSQVDQTTAALQNQQSSLPSNDNIKASIQTVDSGIDIVSVNGSYTTDDSTVQIVLNGRELLTNKQTEKGMLKDISSVWKAFKDNIDYSGFSEIGVSIKYPLSNQGGNTSSEFVIKSSMTGTKLDQLNSTSFDWHNVPTFATSWWQSTALPVLK